MAKKLIPVAPMSLLLAAPLAAQQMAVVSREAIPDDLGSGWALLVDLDGDTVRDLLFHYDGPSFYYRNTGLGRFVRRPIPNFNVPGLYPTYPVVGDFDGDGDDDVLARVSNSVSPPQGYVLENRGVAGPIWHSTPMVLEPFMGTDFNRDGKTDLVTQRGVAITTSLTTFQETVVWTAPDRPLGMADFDGDGDIDILVWRPVLSIGSTFGDRFLWRNDSGAWTRTSPFLGAPPITWFELVPQSTICIDLDGDGDLDCGFLRTQSTQNWELWRNLGNGSFSLMTGPSFGATPLVVADLDRDGDDDLIGRSIWFENTGSASWPPNTLPLMDWSPQAIGDVDGDLDLDLVLVYGQGSSAGAANPLSGGEPRLILNQGAGSFAEANGWAWRRPWQGTTGSALAIGDVDGDTFLDLVGTLDGNLTLYRNQGDGWFDASSGPDLGPSVQFGGYQLRDLDGDRDLDLFFQTAAAINSGSGSFTTTTLALPALPGGWAINDAFDADGDGDIDLLGWVVGSTSPSLTLVRSNGGLSYSGTVSIPLPSTGISAWACADFDGDHDTDLLLSLASPDSIALLRNDGSGTFTLDATGVIGGLGRPAENLDIGDIDADGDLDVLVGRNGTALNTRHAILRNNNGVLVEEPPSALPAHVPGGPARLGDFDGDGDLDAVIQNQIVTQTTTPVAVWCENDGTGRFVSRGAVAPEVRYLHDLDLDGDADVIGTTRLHTNRQWHLEAPFLPQIGTQYVFRCASRAMPNSLAIPWIGTPSNLPRPGFGTIGIDPSTAVPLGWMTLVGETAESSLAVPYTPALVGMPISIQAALIAPDGRLHLTPVKNEIVRS